MSVTLSIKKRKARENEQSIPALPTHYCYSMKLKNICRFRSWVWGKNGCLINKFYCLPHFIRNQFITCRGQVYPVNSKNTCLFILGIVL